MIIFLPFLSILPCLYLLKKIDVPNWYKFWGMVIVVSLIIYPYLVKPDFNAYGYREITVSPWLGLLLVTLIVFSLIFFLVKKIKNPKVKKINSYFFFILYLYSLSYVKFDDSSFWRGLIRHKLIVVDEIVSTALKEGRNIQQIYSENKTELSIFDQVRGTKHGKELQPYQITSSLEIQNEKNYQETYWPGTEDIAPNDSFTILVYYAPFYCRTSTRDTKWWCRKRFH